MTTASYITLSRVFFVPLIIVFMPLNPYIAFVLYIVACLTDMVDGWVARHFNQVTDLGKVFDQIIDKVLILSMFAGIIFRQDIYGLGWMYLITFLIIVFREFVVSGLRMLAGNSGRVIPANIFGKIKTISQMILIGLPLWNQMNVYFKLDNWVVILFMFFVWFTTLYSGYTYYKAIIIDGSKRESEK